MRKFLFLEKCCLIVLPPPVPITCLHALVLIPINAQVLTIRVGFVFKKMLLDSSFLDQLTGVPLQLLISLCLLILIRCLNILYHQGLSCFISTVFWTECQESVWSQWIVISIFRYIWFTASLTKRIKSILLRYSWSSSY